MDFSLDIEENGWPCWLVPYTTNTNNLQFIPISRLYGLQVVQENHNLLSLLSFDLITRAHFIDPTSDSIQVNYDGTITISNCSMYHFEHFRGPSRKTEIHDFCASFFLKRRLLLDDLAAKGGLAHNSFYGLLQRDYAKGQQRKYDFDFPMGRTNPESLFQAVVNMCRIQNNNRNNLTSIPNFLFETKVRNNSLAVLIEPPSRTSLKSPTKSVESTFELQYKQLFEEK